MLMVITNEHSYFIKEEDLSTVELGSLIFNPVTEKLSLILTPGVLTPINNSDALEKLAAAIVAGGEITISEKIDAPTGFAVTLDTIITNNGEITISEDTVGDGVFTVSKGTLTLNGKGIINGLGKNDWSMALWAKGNGKVIINDGYFTNVGAHSVEDSEHFDLIYVSDNAQVEINGGEFKCETPKWTLNIKNNSRETASIVVKGGKFHGFNPSEAEEGNFVAPGYKVVEKNGIFEVMPE